MALYFAFGVMIDPVQMASHCPHARLIGQGRLPRHRLMILSEGYVTLVRDPRREVLGVVYDVPFGEMTGLDRLAERAQKINQPIIMSGGAKRALLHVAPVAGATPSPDDRRRLARAARAAGLPDSYIHEIEHGEPAPRKPGSPLFTAPRSTLQRG